MVLIDALYINKGGGAVLLQYLIEKIIEQKQNDKFFFLLDPRFIIPNILTNNYTVIPNKITERIKFYKQNGTKFTKVFCFANTPPPIRLKAITYTYSHNQKLFEAAKEIFNMHTFKTFLKYLFIKLYNKNTDYYIVQTPHMVNEILSLKLKAEAQCLTIPFYDDTKYSLGFTDFELRPKNEFVFISNPSPQKNYPILLDAWEYLLELGEKPILHVTIDDTAPHLIVKMNKLNEKGAEIINHVYIDPRKLYFNCPYLIFPSIMESFGLPLLEATESRMKVIASNLPYVFDVIQPSSTFDPNDKISIANSVITALKTNLPFPKVVTKNEIDKLITLLIS